MNTKGKCFAIVICWLLCTPALSNLQTIENRKCEITNVIWTKGMDVVIERMPNGRQKKKQHIMWEMDVTRHLYFPIFLLESFGRNHARMKSLYFLSGITFHQILFI